ncbi:MAG: TerC/Alx family metal homeostasis membrane protein [Bacteroidota bacterium]|nr:TerC/Alx family metal homeostasis membrane protein [Bacteroidota bacterium]MDP4211146.1 TerC/Alx family metal homeostasis membrane protein [Bacteroidota bacterium]MDP4249455.1 TerC/Alx family metal homeostasis membrane protein [Bacteroidota bacterium]
MNHSQLAYLIFGIVLVLALVFDLGLLSKKGSVITIRRALLLTAFWVVLALAFFLFLWFDEDRHVAFEYLSAYLMEWSLSIDNIFVFILIFTFFGVKETHFSRILLIGILLAVFFRIIFITAGIALVQEFSWLLYIFGAILLYTGLTMFFAKKEQEVNLEGNKVYRFLKRFLPLTSSDGDGRLTLRIEGRKFYTSLFVVIVLLATTDIIFALDSIPAVFGITQNRLVIYTSNIFAVLGLRSLFFLLRGAVHKFRFLQQGIATVLVFIGLKMLSELVHIKISVAVSLVVILVCILSSILISLVWNKKHPSS